MLIQSKGVATQEERRRGGKHREGVGEERRKEIVKEDGRGVGWEGEK